MSSMLRTLRGGPCRPLTYDRPVAFTLNQDMASSKDWRRRASYGRWMISR
jgi:hypothetical protein